MELNKKMFLLTLGVLILGVQGWTVSNGSMVVHEKMGRIEMKMNDEFQGIPRVRPVFRTPDYIGKINCSLEGFPQDDVVWFCKVGATTPIQVFSLDVFCGRVIGSDNRWQGVSESCHAVYSCEMETWFYYFIIGLAIATVASCVGGCIYREFMLVFAMLLAALFVFIVVNIGASSDGPLTKSNSFLLHTNFTGRAGPEDVVIQWFNY